MERWKKWMPLMVVACGVLAYANSLSCPFIFDDSIAVVGDHGIRQFWPPSWSARFIVRLTFKLNYAISGLAARDFRAFNILVHLLAGLLLYGVVRRTTLLSRFRGRYEGLSTWIGGACGILWVLHPLQTSSVTYICQRYESVVGLFYLLTLYCFIRGHEGKHKRLWYDASLLACAFGMGAKETMVTAPIMILLYDHVFLSAKYPDILKGKWKYYVVLFATWGILAGLEIRMIGASMNMGAPTISSVTPLSYLCTQFGVVTHYLRLGLVPHPLCLDYGWPAASGMTEILPPFLFLLVLGLATLWGLKKRHPGGYLGAWFFVVLAPTSTVLPLQDMAFEYRMYLPLAAEIVFIVAAATQLLLMLFGRDRRLFRVAALSLLLLVSALLLAVTVRRNLDYRSEERMWRDVVAKAPDNLRARNDLAVALSEKNEVAEAMIHYRYVLERTEATVEPIRARVALEANSDEFNRVKALANMALLAFKQGRIDESIELYTEALMIWPYSENVYLKLRKAMMAQGVPESKVDQEIRLRVHSADTHQEIAE